MLGRGGIDKWVEFELRRVNSNLVKRKKKLSELLGEERPSCVTSEGDEYEFDAESLKRFAAAMPQGEELLMPVTLHFSSESPDSCYVTDEVAAAVIRRLEGFGEAYPYRDGKMWLPNSLAYTLMQKYPTAFQGLFL